MLPTWLGVKVTVNEHWPFAAKVVLQVLFANRKSPLAAMAILLNVVVRLLVTVTLCGALVVPTLWAENVRVVCEKVTGRIPTPLTLRTCCPTLALSETTTAPLIVPRYVGVKVTFIVQALVAASTVPAAHGVPPTPVTLKLPLDTIVEIVTEFVLPLVTVTG